MQISSLRCRSIHSFGALHGNDVILPRRYSFGTAYPSGHCRYTLSIGMAIDGNVIIYERIKDEYAAGKSILSAVHYGYRKSVSAILDGNITTIIAAVILYICGSGSVQGFSVTLLIGIVLAVFSSLVVTKGLMDCFVTFNHSNEKFYNLKRSEKYASVAADENDAAVQMDIDSEQKSINAKKRQ